MPVLPGPAAPGSSVREQVVAQMVLALNADPARPATTWRTRIDAFNSSELPAMVLFSGVDTADRVGPNTLLHRLKVRLEILVVGEPPADVAIDPLYVYAVTTLRASAELLAMIREIRETSTQWETEASYQDATLAALDFEVVFVTKADDPTVRVAG